MTTSKMKPSIKRKWLAALRSGKYRRGTGCLKEKGKFCCLGVLCDLHAKAKGNKWESDLYSETRSYLNADSFPPQEVLDWAGLTKSNPSVTVENDPDSIAEGEDAILSESLAGLNDERGYSFKKIADVIAKNL